MASTALSFVNMGTGLPQNGRLNSNTLALSAVETVVVQPNPFGGQ
jgi:hypothetical protein